MSNHIFEEGIDSLSVSFNEIKFYAELLMERLDQTDNKIKADITDTTSYVTFGNQANDPVVDDPDIIVG